jgi:hypothetical protein
VTGRRIVSSPASERGGHARPRGLFAPKPRDSGGAGRHDGGTPGQRDASPPRPDGPGIPAPYDPGPLGEISGPNAMPGQNGMPGQN